MKQDYPSDESYKAAAWMLMVEPRAMEAVAQVEAGAYGAFLDSGEPVILFERHKFDKWTGGRYRDKRVPNTANGWGIISSPIPGGYGPVSVQHQRLAFASTLNRDAALKSTSWGLFQILGENHEAAGYPWLQRFINAMYRDVDDHLRAFVMFIRHDYRMVDALRAKDWAEFARLYNGPAYARNRYDEKMAAAYIELGSTQNA